MSKADKARMPDYLGNILEAIQRIQRYMEAPAFFAGALNRTNELVGDLFATYQGVWRYCADTLKVDAGLLPPMLQESP